MIEWLKINLGLREPDVLTHSPELAKVGAVLHFDNRVVTHVKELAPTALNNGGRARCWGLFTRDSDKKRLI